MLKALKIYLHYHRLNLTKSTVYRLSAWLQVFNLFIWVIVDLLFFQSIFSSVGSFAGWTFRDAVLLIFTLSLFWDIFWRFTSGGIVRLQDRILDGSLNTYLIKPFSPLFNLAISEIGFLSTSLNTPVLLVYYLVNYQFNFSLLQIIGYLAMVLIGVGIFTWILLIIMSLSFWATNVNYLNNLYWELQNISRYPKDIFDGFLANLFMFIIPIFFIVNLPVDVLRHGFNLNNFLTGLLLNGCLFFISTRMWKKGLTVYDSVGI